MVRTLFLGSLMLEERADPRAGETIDAIMQSVQHRVVLSEGYLGAWFQDGFALAYRDDNSQVLMPRAPNLVVGMQSRKDVASFKQLARQWREGILSDNKLPDLLKAAEHVRQGTTIFHYTGIENELIPWEGNLPENAKSTRAYGAISLSFGIEDLPAYNRTIGVVLQDGQFNPTSKMRWRTVRDALLQPIIPREN